ncbi:DNA-binding protein inhibitor ID-1 [Apteryx rowi]|uniref:DNA-binding protein inhibitor ID-1 n=1 Tax=Apteryx rowi TaxID=308060 RepID=UPI000E1DD9DE|nr:DNA-binding protein inhibitor ID-1 [Apteryx rowi]
MGVVGGQGPRGAAARCSARESRLPGAGLGCDPGNCHLPPRRHHSCLAKTLDEPPYRCEDKGCYSRLRALVPTLPRHRRVSKVEILQHVIDYIWDLQLALQRGPPCAAAPGGDPPEAPCMPAADRILCR